MREHPDTARTISALRYFAAPLAVLGILFGTILGCIGISVQAFPLVFWGFLAPVGYFGLILLSTLLLARKASRSTPYLPIVLTLMQLSWGIGFLTSAK